MLLIFIQKIVIFINPDPHTWWYRVQLASNKNMEGEFCQGCMQHKLPSPEALFLAQNALQTV